MEGKMLIEEITADAAKEVVGSRGKPVSEVEDIIENEHNGAAHYGVHHSYHDKLHEGLVGEKLYDFIP